MFGAGGRVKRFEFLEHTADVGIRAYGKTMAETFENAALAMFSLVADLSVVEEKESFRLEVEAEDRESLLVEWLNELIYFLETQNVLLRRFKVEEISDTHLVATGHGEPLDLEKHSVGIQIKATTYHMLKVSHNEYWEAQVIFDV